MSANTIPNRFCSTCGGPLWAVPMDVGYTEVICMNCDNRAKDEPEGDE